MFRIVHATPVHPIAYHTRILLLWLLLLLLLFYTCLLLCCCYYKLLLLINFCEQELFPGAAELTTQLLRLASILWLPLRRINKLGNTTREDCCDPLYLWVITAWISPAMSSSVGTGGIGIPPAL